MAVIQPKTIGQALYWTYSNLVMLFALNETHHGQEYQKIDYMIRNKCYNQFLRGEMQITSLLIDERHKMVFSDHYSYCYETGELSVDHLISRKKGGTDDPANLVMACRSCNSSKGAQDFLEWVVKDWNLAPLHMLRRYLKIAIAYCVERDLMEVSLQRVAALDPPLPFSIEHLPTIVLQIQKFGSEPQHSENDSGATLFDGLGE